MPRTTEGLDSARPSWYDDAATGYASSTAVALCKDTTDSALSSKRKARLVAWLAWLFEWSPPLAIALGHVVTSLWRGFREA